MGASPCWPLPFRVGIGADLRRRCVGAVVVAWLRDCDGGQSLFREVGGRSEAQRLCYLTLPKNASIIDSVVQLLNALNEHRLCRDGFGVG